MDRYDDSWMAAHGHRPPWEGPDRWLRAPRGRRRRYGYDVDSGMRRYGEDFAGYSRRRGYGGPHRPPGWGPGPAGGYDGGFSGGQRSFRSAGYGGYPPEAYSAPGWYERPAAQRDLEGPDDAWIRESVRRALRSDGYLDADAIEVEVDAGVVTLRGEVQDYMQARYAWDDAWDAPGVVGVVSRLVVADSPGGAGEDSRPMGIQR